MTAWMDVKNQMRWYHIIIFLKVKLWNGGKDFSLFFFFLKSDKDKCLFLSHDEGTTKISSQKLKKTLINKLIILSI